MIGEGEFTRKQEDGGGIYKAKGFIGRGWEDIVFFIIRIVFTFCSVHTGKKRILEL